MASTSNSNSISNRLSQRQVNQKSIGLVHCNVGEDSLLHSEETPGKKKRKKGPASESARESGGLGLDAPLEAVGVSVGKKTCRERLLDLLSKHVKPKKPRLSSAKSRIPSKNNLRTTKSPEPASGVGESQSVPGNEVNYTIYPQAHLEEMLRAIGLDTRGLDKEALVKACQAHSDLVTVPGFSDLPHAGPSVTHDYSHSRISEPGGSELVLPTDEQPNPNNIFTIPTSAPGSSRIRTTGKGKGKARACEDSDYTSDGPTPKQPSPQPSPKTTSAEPAGPETPEPSSHRKRSKYDDLKAQVNEQTNTIKHLTTLVNETKTKAEGLEQELRTVCSLVNKLVGNRSSPAEEDRTCGGRIAARMRFHVQTLLGQRDNEDKLPRAATAEEKENWLSDQSIDSVEFNVDLNHLPYNVQGGFPYEDGPGNSKASPQQLSVMWQMMKAVSVSSF